MSEPTDDRKELKFGQTSWDDMSREELLREVWRMYSAAVSARSVLRISRSVDPRSPYWSNRGAGGSALDKCDQVVEPVEEQFSSENIFRAFFRYADDLLFEDRGFEHGYGWAACPVCKRMFGANLDTRIMQTGKRCNDMMETGCEGILRPLTWQDVRPESPA